MDYYEEYKLSCYKILEKLYDKKEVYLVRHQESGLLYILKKVDKQVRTIYQSLQDIQDSHLAKIEELIEADDKLIIIEENINGMNLVDYIERNGVFSEKEVSRIMLALCQTLMKLHQLTPPIIHRDIKPSNLMLDNNGNIYLIDFNVAKEYSEGKQEDTVLMGTREFAAPEQYGFRQSDARTDIYGLGATLNYMLTGKILKQGISEGIFGEIIKKCTMLDPDYRYQNMGELEAAIQNVDIIAKTFDKKEDDRNASKEIPGITFQKKAQKQDTDKTYGRKTWPLYKTAGFILCMLFWIAMSLSLTVTKQDGSMAQPIELWLNRLFMLFWSVSSVIFWFDIGGIRYRLPWMKKGKIIHLLGCVVYSTVWLIFVVMVLAFLEIILGI